MGAGRVYTEADVAEIAERVARGENSHQIARAMGRSPQSVINKVATLRGAGRIPPGRDCTEWTPEMDAQLAALQHADKRHRVIAEIMGLKIEAVKHRIHHLKYKANRAVGYYAAKPQPVKRERPCLCCGAKFWSWGPGNRLCQRCRGESVSPYAL